LTIDKNTIRISFTFNFMVVKNYYFSSFFM
jgi:hypothetical protein